MSFDIISHISDVQDRLSKSEQRVAALILHDSQFVIAHNIGDISKRANVSMPTVTRFCHSIGVDGLRALKLKLSQNMRLDERFLSNDMPINNIEDIAQNILAKAQQALFEVSQQLDLAQMTNVIDLTTRTRQIFAFGSGGISSMLSQEMVNRFFRLQINIAESHDAEMQKMMSATVRKGDTVFLFSVSGYNQNMIECARIAGQYGAKLVAITRHDTPLAKLADHQLLINITEGDYILRPTSSRYAYLALLDILANGVAAKMDVQALEVLRRLRQNQTDEQTDNNSPLGD
ncbi:MAG: MurR/RpiR family transcriptional regulator [Alphaproteobacteria bacterium]|nr:MurR/RpiR family transcriptional regulator [Alphaproteobacteria bacterium]